MSGDVEASTHTLAAAAAGLSLAAAATAAAGSQEGVQGADVMDAASSCPRGPVLLPCCCAAGSGACCCWMVMFTCVPYGSARLCCCWCGWGHGCGGGATAGRGGGGGVVPAASLAWPAATFSGLMCYTLRGASSAGRLGGWAAAPGMVWASGLCEEVAACRPFNVWSSKVT